eukprot:1577710-Pleurochrysis_carterae.AAC.2
MRGAGSMTARTRVNIACVLCTHSVIRCSLRSTTGVGLCQYVETAAMKDRKPRTLSVKKKMAFSLCQNECMIQLKDLCTRPQSRGSNAQQ